MQPYLAKRFCAAREKETDKETERETDRQTDREREKRPERMVVHSNVSVVLVSSHFQRKLLVFRR